MGRHVFVSYSRKDQDYTRKLVEELRRRGFEVWIDDRIDFGDRWWRTIVEAIESCSAFVVVMTPDSEKSEWVEREVQLAMREGRPIFPLLLRGKEFALLIDRQYVNVRDSRMPPVSFYRRLGQEVPGRDVEPEEELVVGIEPEGEERAEAVGLEDLPRTITAGDVEFVLIPAGKFTMGSDTGHDNEKPVHEVHLGGFYIARYPVTNAQYKEFAAATRRRQPDHWKRGTYPGGKRDHPVVNVSWYDAVASCQWLSQVTGESFHLPTEAEWEKAARGTDGIDYPWGDAFDKNKCNTQESDIGNTTPVGKYSAEGASPYGVADMAGNVWEWTSSLWKDYPYNADDGRENPEAEGYRVLRGGSFREDPRFVRCAFRYGYDPGSRYGFIGFRVVVSPGSP